MHEKFLLAAFEQAQKGQGYCAPNPSVGAVAVQNEKIIARAWHKGAGSPHAEQLLLAQFPSKTPGVTVYSTLEPCNHWGRTPPCVDGLINHGVDQVVFSYLDPNPLVAHKHSTEILKQNGLTVLHIPLPLIDEFYQGYAHWTRTKKPRVTVKMAQTFDGKIAGYLGERLQLSNALCGQFTQEKRAATDLILTTAQTVLLDNPKMNVRLNGSERSKPVAILDRRLRLSQKETLFSTAKECLIYHDAQVKGSYPNSTFYPTPLKNGQLDLEAVISHLGALGYHNVWVEAGAELFGALHQHGLVQRTYLYLVPKSLGDRAVSAYHGSELFCRPHSISWQAMSDNMIACLDWQES